MPIATPTNRSAPAQAAQTPAIDYHQQPDPSGHFGRYGGRFVAETLIGPLEELAAAYDAARVDPEFIAEFERDLAHYVGRPSPIYLAQRLSDEVGGARILLKREDLNHTGAHKINNTIGQALLARRTGKRRNIAETGAGQHGVASATVAARLGLECVVYMGATDIERQKINVYRMQLLGATVVPVTSGSRTLKDALNEAMRDWVTNVADTFYIIGTVAGPDPYPRMVRDFNAVDRLLREYSRRNMIPQGGMTLDNVPTAALSEGKPLEELDAMAIFADLMLETRLPPARIRPLVESLERRDTNQARAGNPTTGAVSRTRNRGRSPAEG